MPTKSAVASAALALSLGLSSNAFAAHPRLLFTAGNLPVLRQRATAGTGQALAAPFLAGVTNLLGTSPPSPSDYGNPREAANMLIPLSMAALLEPGDARYTQLARAHLDAYVGWSDWLYGQGEDLAAAHFITAVALTYDWLYPSLSAAERAGVITKLTRECNAMQAASQGSGWWATEYLQNHNWVNNASLGLCALALEGDVPQALTDGWLQTALADLELVRQVQDQIIDGSWHEGIGYQSYGINRLVPFLEALRTLKGIDKTDVAMLRQFPHYRAANLLPGSPRTYLIDSGDTWGWDGVQSMFENLWAARRFGDGVAQAVGLAWMQAGPLDTYVPDIASEVFAFLLYDPSVAPADLTALPLDARFADLQAAIFRSDPGADATMVGLKSGPYGGEATLARLNGAPGPVGQINIGHDHADDNGLYLYGKGQPLIPEAAGYNAGTNNGHPPAQETRFHNSLLVDGQGQLGEIRLGDDENGFAWARGRAAGIPLGASTEHFAFAQGSAAQTYPAALGLSRFNRQVLMVNRRYVVVRDLVASSAPHTFSQAWHFLDGATSDGSWIRGVAKNGKLAGVRVISPSGYGFVTHSQSPDNVQHLDPNSAIVEAEVSTPSAASSARMLSLLWPSDTASWAARPQVTPLSATSGAGLVLTDGAAVDEVLFHDDASASSTEGDLTLTGLGAVVSTEAGAMTHAFLLQGTRLVRAGATLLLLPAPASIEVSLQGSALTVTGQGVNVFQAFAPGTTQVSVDGHEVPFALQGETVFVPPPGQAPASPGQLVNPAHPSWVTQSGGASEAWMGGTGGWPTGSSAGSTSGTSTSGTSATGSTTGTTGGGSTTGAGSTSSSSSTGTTTSSSSSSSATGGGGGGHPVLTTPLPKPEMTPIVGKIGCGSAGVLDLGPVLLALGALFNRRRRR